MEATTVLETAIADYRTAMGVRADLPPAKNIVARLERGINDVREGQLAEAADPAIGEKIVAFARITKVWPPQPPPSPDIIEIKGGLRNRPLLREEWYSLLEALVKGMAHKVEVVERTARERKVRDAILEASDLMIALEGIVNHLDDPDIRYAYKELDRQFGRRAAGMRGYLSSVKREGLTAANPKTELDGPTREGLRHAALAIKAMCGEATNPDIELVLSAAFGVDAELVYVKNLTARTWSRKARPRKS